MDNKKLPLVSAIALNKLFGNEAKLSNRLIETYGSTEAVFSLPPSELYSIFGNSKYSSLINEYSLEAAEKEMDLLLRKGYRFISISDPEYPQALRECPDAPILLYVRSKSPCGELFRRPCVSVVGTRDMSLYGRDYCIKIVEALAEAPCKPIIVSGLAIGIDITAHTAALDKGLATVAVSPVGINEIYPHRHIAAASKIADTAECAVITDYPPGTPTLPQNFLRRNRIIAGLSENTILVESRIRGGGMMTARLAAGYGRSVFALPGRIDDLPSQGCNELVARQLAAPIYSIGDLSEALGLGKYNMRRKADIMQIVRDRFRGRYPDTEVELLAGITGLIKKRRGISYEEICEAGQMSYSEVARYAGLLENEAFINIDVLQRCSINTKNA